MIVIDILDKIVNICNELDAIEELTKLKIKEHFKKENKIIKMSIEELIQFSINLIKTIERYK